MGLYRIFHRNFVRQRKIGINPCAYSFTRLTLLLLTLGVGASQAQTSQPWTGPKIRLAVMDFSGSAFKETVKKDRDSRTTTIPLPAPAEFALGLTEMLTTELVETGRFIVLERASLKQVTGEQDLGASGRVNRETAAASEGIIGAQMIITGDITEFTYNQTNIGGKLKLLKSIQAGSERVTAMVALDIRLIDAVTGEVVFSQRAEGKASMTGASGEIARGNQQFSLSGYKNTPLGQASRQAINGAVDAVVSSLKLVPWSGRIVDVRQGLIYINAGVEQGLKPGMELDVYTQQQALIDPESGQTLGTPDRRIGTLKLRDVQEKYAVAEATNGSGFSRNNLVRFRGEPQKP